MLSCAARFAPGGPGRRNGLRRGEPSSRGMAGASSGCAHGSIDHTVESRGMSKRAPTNEAIRAADVLLLDEDGADLGILSRDRALALARQRGLDLVQIDSASSPP